MINLKRIIYFIFILLSLKLYAQDFTSVDQKIVNYKEYYDLYEITDKISSDFDTDLEKVRAVYKWITYNIAYSYRVTYSAKSINYQTEEELVKKRRLRQVKIAQNTIIKRAGVCHGYATLFKEMCDILNIESRIVDGMAKNEINDIDKKYESNHSWNIVRLKGKEYLIDTTWGAGSYDAKKGFIKNNNDLYFFTDPEKMIKNHYPDDYNDSLLSEKISKETFLKTPIYYIKNMDSLELVSPRLGEINKKIHSIVKFRYKVNKEINRVSYLLGDTFHDVSNSTVEDNFLSFELSLFKVKENKLLIYINNKPINGFRLR